MIKAIISAIGGWQLIAGLGLVSGLAGGVMWWSEHEYDAGRTEERAVWQRKQAIDQAEAEIRRREIAQQHQEIIDGAKRESLRLEVERNAVVADGVRLRQQYAAALQARCVARASAAGPPAGDPIGMFAEVFGRIESAAERYAAEADANRIAGDACEKAYAAVTERGDMDGGRLDH